MIQKNKYNREEKIYYPKGIHACIENLLPKSFYSYQNYFIRLNHGFNYRSIPMDQSTVRLVCNGLYQYMVSYIYNDRLVCMYRLYHVVELVFDSIVWNVL